MKIITGGDCKVIQKLFSDHRPTFDIVTREEALEQYNVLDHGVFDTRVRKKKTIIKDTGKRDANNQPITQTVQIDVNRIGLPFQKLIVNRRVGFMLTIPVKNELQNKQNEKPSQELLEMLNTILNDNKVEYRNKEVARRLMSEMEVAELWYITENKNPELDAKFSLRLKVLSQGLKDDLYPLFNDFGDMIAFARGYKTIDENSKSISHFDVYTEDFTYSWIEKEGNWILDNELVDSVNNSIPNPTPNPIGKIPIIYYSQPEPEWSDVQSLIERLELILSNYAEINDYFGSPILAVSGKVSGYAAKGEVGKIIELTNNAQANYLSLSSEPSSIITEIETLFKYIHTMSQTPNITFEEMKSIGVVSGIALQLLFLDAHMAVKNVEERFGIGLQRRDNLLKGAIGELIDTSKSKVASTTQIKPVLTAYLPDDVAGLLSNLSAAVNAGLMSKQTARSLNTLVTDKEAEEELIRKEAEEVDKREVSKANKMSKGNFNTQE